MNRQNNETESTGFLDRYFKLSQHGTTVKTEMMAGLTTFVTMSYIIFLNPDIMSKSGMPFDAAFVATCLGAALATILMGLYANWPVGLAPGMGLNAFFTFGVVKGMGYSWEIALGAVFWAGVIFVIMSVTKIREWMLESIPLSLRLSMTAGVGLFLGLIGLRFTGIVVPNSETLVAVGDFTHFGVGPYGAEAPALGLLSFLLISILSYRRVFGGALIGILVTTVIGLLMGLVFFPEDGLVSMPPSIEPVLFKVDIMGALELAMVPVIITFLFVNVFDTAGTLMGVANRAGLQDENGKIEGLSKSLKADSASSVIGTAFGCPPVTSYVESAAGVAAGGRTGLTAVTIGALFLLAMFFAPLAGMIPGYAVNGALIYVAVVMFSSMAGIKWDDLTEATPALMTAIMMPLTFSIANGIAIGFITYTALKLFTGQARAISGGVYFLTALFIAKFVFLG